MRFPHNPTDPANNGVSAMIMQIWMNAADQIMALQMHLPSTSLHSCACLKYYFCIFLSHSSTRGATKIAITIGHAACTVLSMHLFIHVILDAETITIWNVVRVHYFHRSDLIVIAAPKLERSVIGQFALLNPPPEMNMWGLTMGTKTVWWFHSISGALTICLDNPGKEEIWHKCSHKSI